MKKINAKSVGIASQALWRLLVILPMKLVVARQGKNRLSRPFPEVFQDFNEIG